MIQRFPDAPGAGSPGELNRISFPSGDQSCLIPGSNELGVNRLRPVPSAWTDMSA